MSVLNPIFFFAFIGLLIPVLIHFFGTKKHKQFLISNVQFLISIKKNNLNINKLLHLLLLFTRLCLLFFLIVSFLKPGFFKGSVSKYSPAFFFDNSPSICENADKLNINSVRNQLAEKREKGPGFNKIYNDCEFNNARNLSIFLSSSNSNNREKVIFSDFQDPILNKIIPDSEDKLTLVSFSNTSRNFNVFVDSLWMSEVFIKTNIDMKLQVNIRNSGNTEAKDVIIEYKLGGTSLSSKTLNIPANQLQKISFPINLKVKGYQSGEILIKDNSWNFDNHFYFSFSTTDRVEILNVNQNTNSSDPFQIAYSQDDAFKIKSVKAISNASADIDKSRMLVYNNHSISDILQLVSYINEGKTVLLLPDNNWKEQDLKMLNKVFNREIIKSRLPLDLKLQEPDLKNPFFFNIFESHPEFTSLPNINSHYGLSSPDEVILKATNNEAILARYSFGKGNVYITSFDPDNNPSFSHNAIFLPLVYKIAERSMVNKLKPYYNTSSTSIEFAAQNKGEDLYSINLKDEEIIPEQKSNNGYVKLILPQEDIKPGNWHIKNKVGNVVARFGINVEKSESQVSFANAEELQKLFKGNPNIKVIDSDSYRKQLLKNQTVRAESEYWRFFLLLTFIFLLFEIILGRFHKLVLK